MHLLSIGVILFENFFIVSCLILGLHVNLMLDKFTASTFYHVIQFVFNLRPVSLLVHFLNSV